MNNNPEELELKLRPRVTEVFSLNIPTDTLASLAEVAASKDMSVEALLKFYIGQGLRQDIEKLFNERLLDKTAQSLLEVKVKMMQEIKDNYRPDPHKQALAKEFIALCKETQALHADNPLTEKEIAEEIDAYRRGE